MKKINIEILDSIECQIPKEQHILIHQFLSHDAVYWKQGPYKKTCKQYRKSVLTFNGKKWCRFYTGLLPSLKKWCKEQEIQVEIIGEEFKIEPTKKPYLEGITFREDQLNFINKACASGRGLCVAPTQSGKTLVFLGIMSCYPELNILILSHTTGIVTQTYERLIKNGFKDVEYFGGGEKVKKPSKRIVVSTIQSFSRLPTEQYMDYFDMAIVDEVQRVSKPNSQYEKVLSHLLAPCRFGFSATPKEGIPEAEFMYEGLLGPIIARLTIQEATDLNILNKPTIKLVNSIMPKEIESIYKYQDTYKKIRQNGKLINGKRLEKGSYTAGISENKYRNDQIVEIATDYIKEGKTVFIFVTYTEHGILLQKGLKEKLNIPIPFVYGATPEDERKQIKKQLKNKKIKICLASQAWMEGMTIKTLTDLILAGGGRSALQLLQKVGRVLANDNVTITYFIDSKNKHLALHTTEILSVFVKKGWL